MTLTTWNPADKAAGITLSNGNNTATGSSGNNSVRGTTSHAPSDGKFYFEFNTITMVGGSGVIGLENAAVGLTTNSTNGMGVSPSGGFPGGSFGADPTGVVIGVAVDAVHLRVWFRYDAGNWNNSGTADPATNTGGIDYSGMSGGDTVFPFVFLQNGGTVTINTDSTSFAHAAPSGFDPWDGAASVSGTWASTEAADIFVGFGLLPDSGVWASTESKDTWATSTGFDRLDIENVVDTDGSGITLTTNGPDRILIYIEMGVAVTSQATMITSITDTAGLTWKQHLGLVAGEDTNSDNTKVEIWWAYAHDTLASNTLTITPDGGGTTTGAGVGFAVKGMNGNYNYPFDDSENPFSQGGTIGSYFGGDTVPSSQRPYSDGPAEAAGGGTPIFTHATDAAISGGGLTITETGSGGFAFLDPSAGVAGGRYYFETTFTTISGTNYGAGFFYWPSGALGTLFASGAGGFTVRGDGTLWNGSDITNLGVTPANGDVIGIALDLDNGLAWAKDITQSSHWNGDIHADPTNGVGGIGIPVSTDSLAHSIGASNAVNIAVPFASVAGSGAVLTYDFAVTPPNGFQDWPGATTPGTDGPFPALRVAATMSITDGAGFGIVDGLNGSWITDVLNARSGSQRNMAYIVEHELLGSNVLLSSNDVLHGTSAAPVWSLMYFTMVPGFTDPGSFVSTEAKDVLNFRGFVGSPGIVGDLTATEATDIAAIVGFERDSGVWFSTEAKDIFGAAGRVPLVGHLAATEHADIFAGTGIGLGEDGVWVSTEATDIFSASGHTPITASLVATEVADRFVAIGAGVTQLARRRQLIVA